MAGMRILIVGILIVIAFLAISTAVIAMAPYIAVGVIVIVALFAMFGGKEEKPPE
ncbi:hypothetical protein [Erwinia phage Kuerle]|nr:hypothetical protein [Erwinia phage Kuerle]